MRAPTFEMTHKKKLIEVALPHDAINAGSAREKSIRHGHPSTLHLWLARRPLAAARAVIFAQMVDYPSAHPDLFPTEKKQEMEKTKGVGAVSHPPQLRATISDLSPWRRSLKKRSDPSTGPPRACTIYAWRAGGTGNNCVLI